MARSRVSFLIAPTDPWRDILLVELMELGYDGFEETTGGLDAYIDTTRFDAKSLERTSVLRERDAHVSWGVEQVEERNWNAEWERSFEPIEIDGLVRIRAEHHAPSDLPYDIVITPRMAFGTGHHATTRMMVRAMLKEGDLSGMKVCDLGCGSAVLAILAARMGASVVDAFDSDEQALSNARDNIQRNNCADVHVEKAMAADLKDLRYDLILANIERNTLLDAMPAMAASLAPKGKLALSGFVHEDRRTMECAARSHGLDPIWSLQEGDWAMLVVEAPALNIPGTA